MIVALIGSEGRLGTLIKESPIIITYHFDIDNIEKFYQIPRCDVVIHLGEYSEPNISLDMALANAVSSANILQHSRKIGVDHFIYASSHRRYGSWEEAFKNGRYVDRLEPVTFYGATKGLMEDILKISSLSTKMQLSVLRIGTLMNDEMDNATLEDINNEWRGKYSFTRISSKEFISFMNCLVNIKQPGRYEVYNLIPEQSDLNNFFDGENFNNY